MSRKHTPGPWQSAEPWQYDGTAVFTEGNNSKRTNVVLLMFPSGRGQEEKKSANRDLILAAPAMDLVLRAISCGIARIERSCKLVEFWYRSIRHQVDDCDWNRLLNSIGWSTLEKDLEFFEV